MVVELDGEAIWGALEAGFSTWPAQEGSVYWPYPAPLIYNIPQTFPSDIWIPCIMGLSSASRTAGRGRMAHAGTIGKRRGLTDAKWRLDPRLYHRDDARKRFAG